jgi:hypothetical protein
MGMINATSGHLGCFDVTLECTHVTSKQERCLDVAFIVPMLHQNKKDVLM